MDSRGALLSDISMGERKREDKVKKRGWHPDPEGQPFYVRRATDWSGDARTARQLRHVDRWSAAGLVVVGFLLYLFTALTAFASPEGVVVVLVALTVLAGVGAVALFIRSFSWEDLEDTSS